MKKDSKPIYELDTPQHRIDCQERLYTIASESKAEEEEKWRVQRAYYNGEHESAKAITETFKDAGISFSAATVTDAYLHTETQLIAEVPNFEFNGRDNDGDEDKAKQREYCVKYVLENNRIQDFKMYLERLIGIDGNAFMKIFYDATMKQDNMGNGDIRILPIDSYSMYPDPAALRLEDCEYIIYKYRLHVNKAKRLYGKYIKSQKYDPEDVFAESEDLDNHTDVSSEDTLEVREYWFKHVEDGTYVSTWMDDDGLKHTEKRSYKAGDIACSVQINKHEVKYIPCYWQNTREQNQCFPFVQLCKTQAINKLWATGEIERIRLLIDAADRELIYAQINRAFQAGDAIIADRTKLEDGEIDSVMPWQVIYTNGDTQAVRRLGGLNTMPDGLANMQAIQSQIERTISNFDVSRGEKMAKASTATEVTILQQQTQSKLGLKNADILNGWERIIELIDWCCLEFYDEDKMIFIGVDGRQTLPQQQNLDEKQGNIIFTYNSSNMRVKYKDEILALADEVDESGNPVTETVPIFDENGQQMMTPPSLFGFRAPQPILKDVVKQTMQVVQEAQYYYPKVDCKVTASDGARQGKAFTTAMLESLIKVPVTPDNYKIVVELIKQLDLPNSTELVDYYEKTYNIMPQLVAENEQLKALLGQIGEQVSQTGDVIKQQKDKAAQAQSQSMPKMPMPQPQRQIPMSGKQPYPTQFQAQQSPLKI